MSVMKQAMNVKLINHKPIAKNKKKLFISTHINEQRT